ncbi:hypothetical protein [Rhodovulum sp.]|uniref:hypothetical protein n=1 Tax=Rhodovulum sp. TaxID=34009 RepID=UPI00181335C5|nr:hypothetical protein [Rhodovulum sp.]HDR27389.1 hypothetical protein [Rhodovulum sp.]
MQVILHIGAPKTGTTILQKTLRRSERVLAAHGIAYPRSPRHKSKHRILLVGIGSLGRAGASRFPDETRHDDQRKAWFARLGRQLRKTSPEILVLSNEGLFGVLPPDRLAALREDILSLGADHIRIAGYVRRPSDHYLSWLQQEIRASWKVPLPAPLNCRQVLEPYMDVFGAGNVLIRTYDRATLCEGDIVADFVNAYLGVSGLSRSDPREGRDGNISLSGEAMTLVRQYRQDFHHDNDDVFTSDTTALMRAIRQIEDRIGPTRPRLRPELSVWLDSVSDDPLWLRETFGAVFPGYDYGTRPDAWPRRPPVPEQPSLTDIIAIDREKQRRMIDELGRSAWVGNSPPGFGWLPGRGARRDWLAGLRNAPPD